MRFIFCILFLCFAASLANAKIYFQEGFNGDWESRWVVSDAKSGLGKWDVSSGNWFGDAEADKGLMTTENARFYDISAKFDEDFSNQDKDMVVQFSVKHQQEIDCGGGYVKIHSNSFVQEELEGESEYNIMFGPDICGTDRKVHVILNYKGKNYLIKKKIDAVHDDLTHVYTLILRADQTYEVKIDGESRQEGSLVDDWDFLPPKEIIDESQTKPDDWVDEEMMVDPNDVKPDDWDDVPESIVDPDTEKPDDWDDEVDGEWDAPMIDNPDYEGEWEPKMIPNPNYKGPWVQPTKQNDAYEVDTEIYNFPSHNFISFDLWQVKSGTIFDNIIVTDDVKEAEELLETTWALNSEEEMAMRDEVLEARAVIEDGIDDDSDDDDDDDDDDDEEEEEDEGHGDHDEL